ncbi:unnamed protein product [Acanthoscelides obtectus]|uniref:MADF domain-containing protein n=1 Tax=Acanthoscelides obtectus TaxID=200917 RepID=A0A9P0KZB0_ACAOB|nr:unnamed protein product [Acanthoscelides obtectus]CAK1643974.1 hypothetical protein AOBTE_LOCUS13759 [Acanthoscelides obtectus]
MEWNNEKVLEFIQFYETENIIWNPSNPDHKKKHLVHDAWTRIQNRLSWPTTIEEMKRKKDSLMSYYRAHLNKIKKSMRSGAGTDDIYQTNWFGFSAMNSFLQPIYDCRRTIDTQNESVREEHAERDDEHEGITVSRSEEDSTPTPPINSNITNKRAKIDFPSEILHAKRQMQEAFEHVKGSVNDEYEMFGKLIAAKIRKLKNPNTRDILMNDIHSMVINAGMIDRVHPTHPYHSQIHSSLHQNQTYRSPTHPSPSQLPKNHTYHSSNQSSPSPSPPTQTYQSPIHPSPSQNQTMPSQKTSQFVISETGDIVFI